MKKIEQFSINSELVTVEHGDRFGHHPSHDELRAAYPDSKLIIYGHTHNQVCDQSGTPWIVNPGAAGHTRNNDGGPCYMEIFINDNELGNKTSLYKIMNDKVLTIFGGSGFIASELVYKLSENFKEVRLLSRSVENCKNLKVIKNVDVSYMIHPI